MCLTYCYLESFFVGGGNVDTGSNPCGRECAVCGGDLLACNVIEDDILAFGNNSVAVICDCGNGDVVYRG